MKEVAEYRLFTRPEGTTVWDRWSGGVSRDRGYWIDIAQRDAARRERGNFSKLEYAIRKRTIVDWDYEPITVKR